MMYGRWFDSYVVLLDGVCYLSGVSLCMNILLSVSVGENVGNVWFDLLSSVVILDSLILLNSVIELLC